MAQGNQDSKYVGAPYNFVPFHESVCEYPEDSLPGHDDTSISSDGKNQLYSGEIDYSVEAETPIFIGSGKEKADTPERFFRTAEGRFAIPGSTMRGLIRSNVQILSMSSFAEDIDDYALMYRKVAGKHSNDPDAKLYKNKLGFFSNTSYIQGEKRTVSGLKNVRAGYVRREKTGYRIYDTCLNALNKQMPGDMNYYILSEKRIAESYQAYMDRNHNRYTDAFEYSFFLKDGNFFTPHDLKKHFVKKGREYEGTPNNRYKPYSKKCSYNVKGTSVTAVGIPGRYDQEGYAVSTGFMKNKKAIYIIPEMDTSTVKRYDKYYFPIEISDEDLKAFKTDLKKRETTLKDVSWFDLPAEGEEPRPIFYILLDSHLYFGFTPYMRIFYDYTIWDGLPEALKKSKLDYAKAIFGFGGEKSYRSRVSFSDALSLGNVQEGGIQERILGEPKPTSYKDYVLPRNDSTGISYNGDNKSGNTFRLRGVKQYWLHEKITEEGPEERKNKNVVTAFIPLETGTLFSGKIRFHNLKKEELGLLLYSLKLEDSSRMNIGKAKAFGFGRIRVEVTKVKLLDIEKLCDLHAISLEPFTELDSSVQKEFLDSYEKTFIEKFCGRKKPESIRTFLLMKDSRVLPKPSRIKQMKLEDYKDREPLQNVSELVEKPLLSKGSTYSAKVKRIEGKKVHFFIEEVQKHDKFSVEDIRFEAVTRKTLPGILKAEDMVEVQITEIETEGSTTKYHWSCNRKL